MADGINSRFREKYADHFEPEVDLRPNKFAWMGSTRPLDAFTFIFQETEWGPFIAHAYQYEADRSTWVFETDPETFERAGLKGLTSRNPPPSWQRSSAGSSTATRCSPTARCGAISR